MKVKITTVERLIGEVNIPGDKSISHRGIMLGALSQGDTKLTNFLMGEDCFSTIKAFQSLGIEIDIIEDGIIIIHGKGLYGLKQPSNAIDAGNSGTTTRLLLGILAGQPFESILDGDPSLRKRPMGRIIEPLQQMGARIKASDDKSLPLVIQGGELRGIEYTLPVASAQVKSAIILATLYAKSSSIIHQPAQSRNHTEIMLEFFGGKINIDGTTITAYPAQELTWQEIRVPGDISSAAFFITAGLLCPNSQLIMKGVGINPTRMGIVEVYQQMGANIRIENIDITKGEPVGDIIVSHSELNSVTLGGEIIPRLIDEIPIIALAATQAQGTTIIRDAAELKVKESNRIDTVVHTLRMLGANIEATDDGMIIHGPTPLTGNIITCNMDHRIAMMGAVAGLIAKGETIITDGEWVDVSFPGFFEAIQKLRS